MTDCGWQHLNCSLDSWGWNQHMLMCATNKWSEFLDSWSPSVFSPQSLLKCHRNVSGTFALFGEIAGFTQSSMKLVGSEWEEEESSGKKRQGVPWQLLLTHTQSTKHIRGHSWQKHKEGGWDKNNKQIMFMDSSVYPTYLIAVWVCACWISSLYDKDKGWLLAQHFRCSLRKNEMDYSCHEAVKTHTSRQQTLTRLS